MKKERRRRLKSPIIMLYGSIPFEFGLASTLLEESGGRLDVNNEVNSQPTNDF